MKANDFDEYFDDGGSVMPFADMSKAERPNVKTKRVNVDFPAWMVEAMDQEADRIGITRQAFIKVVIAERLGSLTQQA